MGSKMPWVRAQLWQDGQPIENPIFVNGLVRSALWHYVDVQCRFEALWRIRGVFARSTTLWQVCFCCPTSYQTATASSTPPSTPPANTQPLPQVPNPAANLRNAQQPANQNIRMNAQGGPVDDDDEDEFGQRDWLDWVYTFSRFGVLLSIVYFYSTMSRFIVVFLFFFVVYLWVFTKTSFFYWWLFQTQIL